MKQIAIIGGGAAGFFAAINLLEVSENMKVTIYESASKTLAKLAVTGGGRCNLTNSFEAVKNLSQAYPRGDKLMKRIFGRFNHKDTFAWFEQHGVPLVTQDDHCVFPRSQDAMEVVRLLQNRARTLGATTKVSHRVSAIVKEGEHFKISFKLPECEDEYADAVIVATGGSPRVESLSFLNKLPLKMIAPVPSLFSFNLADDGVSSLMGTVADPVQVSIQGTKFKASGTLLITHWGMSGPAILKLSSYAARMLHDCNYNAKLSVNWHCGNEADVVRHEIENATRQHAAKQLASVKICDVPSRLWAYLLYRANLIPERRWAELGQKGINRLVNTLTNDEYQINGKNRFKDEFVTCGGVSLESINLSTLECRTCANLYFAGEALDVDAITGGFNLQAAWSMGWVAAQEIAAKI